MVAFRADVKVLLDRALIEHMLAARTPYPEPFGHLLTRLQRKTIPL